MTTHFVVRSSHLHVENCNWQSQHGAGCSDPKVVSQSSVTGEYCDCHPGCYKELVICSNKTALAEWIMLLSQKMSPLNFLDCSHIAKAQKSD